MRHLHGRAIRVARKAGGMWRSSTPWGFVKRIASILVRKSRAHKSAFARQRPLLLGARVATAGPRADAVFRAAGSTLRPTGDHVDVVVVDTVDLRTVEAPVVVLADAPKLAVPAFDPIAHNPIRWERDANPRAVALGSPSLLPPGADLRVVKNPDHPVVRYCHHLEDTRAFHGDAIARAGTLVRLAATGLPIHLADRDAELEDLLGAELHGLMAADVPVADARARELRSIRTRRLALRDHSLWSRVRQVSEAALDDPPQVPLVSVLLATMRPCFLSWAFANVAKQNYPRIQVALALHGDAFDARVVDRAVAELPFPVDFVRVPEHLAHGSVLNAAVSVATGDLLTTMDDDDLYGPDHVWDLVLAHQYSGAELVGKGSEVVYLRELDQTVERFRGTAECYFNSISGATFMIAREDLRRVGGWKRVRHPDVALRDDVVRAGGRVYRTHGAGFVVVRHGQHTWSAQNDYFLDRADAVHDGWRPDLADVHSPPPPEPA